LRRRRPIATATFHAAAFVATGYPMIALGVGPYGLLWLRKRRANVRPASWFLAIGTSAICVVSVLAHDGWASALMLGSVLACLCFLARRKYRP